MITFLLNLIFHCSVEQYQNHLFNEIVPSTFFWFEKCFEYIDLAIYYHKITQCWLCSYNITVVQNSTYEVFFPRQLSTLLKRKPRFNHEPIFDWITRNATNLFKDS